MRARQRYWLRLVEAQEYQLVHRNAKAPPVGYDVKLDPQLVARHQRAQQELRAAGRAVHAVHAVHAALAGQIEDQELPQ